MNPERERHTVTTESEPQPPYPWQRYPIKDDQQAYVSGLVVGLALKHGLDVEPILDPAGNYTAAMWLKIPRGLYGPEAELSIVITVPPQLGPHE
jgi:hypothetical protein